MLFNFHELSGVWIKGVSILLVILSDWKMNSLLLLFCQSREVWTVKPFTNTLNESIWPNIFYML